MAKPQRNPRPVARETIQRPTTMAHAFAKLADSIGLDTATVSLPSKREPSWRVTRRR